MCLCTECGYLTLYVMLKTFHLSRPCVLIPLINGKLQLQATRRCVSMHKLQDLSVSVCHTRSLSLQEKNSAMLIKFWLNAISISIGFLTKLSHSLH